MSTKSFRPESVATLVTTNVPIVSPDTKVSEVMELISKKDWDSVSQIYVVSKMEDHLLGLIPIQKLVSSSGSTLCEDLLKKPITVVHEDTDQERVTVEAISNDLKSIPVTDSEGRFKGAVTADRIIDVLHEEHLEDFLRSSGIRGRGSKILDLMSANFFDLVKSRLPWLVVGLVIGLLASVVVSFFEGEVSENISLVFFMPIVAFMSGAIGTQTETVFIRSLTFLKFNVFRYIVKELILGMVIGGVIGMITGIFGYMLSGSFSIGAVIAVSLFASMSVATILGVLVPLLLKFFGKDPAVGSGPFITSLQDLISLTIYFSIAYLLLH